MQIRPYQTEDSAALWQVIGPAIQAGETFALPREMSAAAAIAYWTAPDREVFVAEQDGVVAGSFFVRPNQLGGGAHIANGGYATLPEARGRGIARAMCMRSLDVARQRGFTAMQFNFVITSNIGAMTLWQRCGFDIIGRMPGVFNHPRLGFVDAVIMFRQL